MSSSATAALCLPFGAAASERTSDWVVMSDRGRIRERNILGEWLQAGGRKFAGGNLGEVLLSGLENQEKEVFPRKKEKSPF